MSEPFAQHPFGAYPVPEPPRRSRGRHALGLTATAVVALAVGAGAGIGLSQGGSTPTGNATATSKTMLSTSQIASRVDPGLVDVTSTLGYQGATAMGTGIVLTSNGEILTNNHVVNGATSVSVTDIGNGKTYKATVVGYDESHDVAVLQLSGASGLTTATTGNSSTVKVGDNVVGLGNAGGAGGTPSVAPGAVTALNQSITASDEGGGSSEQLSGLIETNADIQPGDSGGPLVNSYGQIIGMDTAASTSGSQVGGSGGSGDPFGGFGGFGDGSGSGFGGSGSTGSGSTGSGSTGSSGSGQASTTQGYAIPIDTALSIAAQIEAGQASSTVHIGATAFLGLEIASSDQQGSSGVALAGAASGTPAATAGLGQGDVVTSLNGETVSSSTDIQKIMVGLHPGDKVSIGWTDATGQSHTATVTLASGPTA
ncbi:MAG TPA: trypsin-like peptidase domain-containing protein [Trebonia sp.]|jgi:S1-C subfamily serine protease|nr:trypsin-like peptidase domain-containing protein [Trebonia sp.]